MNAKHLLWGAVLLGTGAGYVWSASPQVARPLPAAADASTASAAATPEEIEHSRYFANCNEARAAGVAPMFRGQPGYREDLDGDSDGVACEPIRTY